MCTSLGGKHKSTLYGTVGGASGGTIRFKAGTTVHTYAVQTNGSYSTGTLEAQVWNVAYKPPGGTYGATSPPTVETTAFVGLCQQNF